MQAGCGWRGKHSSKLTVAGSCFSSSFALCLLLLDLRPSGGPYWPKVMSPCCLHYQTASCPKYKTKNTKRERLYQKIKNVLNSVMQCNEKIATFTINIRNNTNNLKCTGHCTGRLSRAVWLLLFTQTSYGFDSLTGRKAFNVRDTDTLHHFDE